MLLKKLSVWLLLMSVAMGQLFSQGFHTEFGKSRVQYENFRWYFFRTSDFEVYYHQGGRNLALYVLENGKKFLDEIEEKLDFHLGERVTVVIYNTYSDYRQSNIPLMEEFYNTGGLTPVSDNIAFVYFEGDHKKFEKTIKSSFAEIVLNSMLYGSSVQQRIQNLALMSLPDWYYYSITKYLSGDWSLMDELNLEAGLNSGRFKKFNRLSKNEKIIVGYALWKYITEKYGNGALSNIVYYTHINKSIDAGFNYMIGKSFNDIYADWFKFSQYRYLSKSPEKFNTPLPPFKEIKWPKKRTITSFSVSNFSDRIALSTLKNGKTEIFILDPSGKKKKKIFKSGYQHFDLHQDMSYPLIKWSPAEDKLVAIYEKKSVPRIMVYDHAKRKITYRADLENIDKVLSFNLDPRGQLLVMSAIKNGSSDIFVYQLRSRRLFQITRDLYDDLYPVFDPYSLKILFSSNRSSLSLQQKNIDFKDFSPSFDIYSYDFAHKSKFLKKLTFTENNDEFYPFPFDSIYYCYLTASNSINNINLVRPDSIFKYIQVLIQYHHEDRFKNDTFYYYTQDTHAISYTFKTYYDTLIKPASKWDSLLSMWVDDTAITLKTAPVKKIDTFFVYKDTAYSYLLTDFPYSLLSMEVKPTRHKMIQLFYLQNHYQLGYSNMAELQANRPQKRLPPDKIFITPTQTTETQTKLADQQKSRLILLNPPEILPPDSFPFYFLNDYTIKNILQLESDSFNRFEYFKRLINSNKLILSDNQKKFNFKSRFGPSSMYFINFIPDYLVSQFDNSYLETPYLPYDGTMPITPFSKATDAFFMLGIKDIFKDYKMAGGFRLQSNLRGAEYLFRFENLKKRLDKTFVLYRNSEISDAEYTRYKTLTHIGRVRLNYPFTEYSALRGEVFIRQDRKITMSSELTTLREPDLVNNFTGGKIEYVFDNSRELARNILQGTRFKAYIENYRWLRDFKSEFFVYGFDARNYIKIHKELIWANRFAFASSVGQSKVVFMLGGVDNWLFPKINSDIQVDPEINFRYKSLAVNMRGFTQNIRNGNSYALWNSELRVPIFKYLSSRPLRSDFWENVQIVAFFDAGTAWTGFNPYSAENSLNKRIIEKNPFKITVITVGEPLVGGFGMGIRAVLMGYFVRLDYARGIEGGYIYDKILYLSFGLDF